MRRWPPTPAPSDRAIQGGQGEREVGGENRGPGTVGGGENQSPPEVSLVEEYQFVYNQYFKKKGEGGGDKREREGAEGEGEPEPLPEPPAPQGPQKKRTPLPSKTQYVPCSEYSSKTPECRRTPMPLRFSLEKKHNLFGGVVSHGAPWVWSF